MAVFFAFNPEQSNKDRQDPAPRYDSFEALEAAEKKQWEPLSEVPEGMIKNITDNKNLRVAMGIVTEDGKVASTEGVPRMFIIGKDENGKDKVMTLEEAGAPAGSREFWKQAQLGNLYGYVPGEVNPSQIRMTYRGSVSKLIISKPIEPDKFPAPPSGRRPGFFQRFLHSINKNWSSRATRTYYEKEAEAKAIRKTVSDMTKKRQPHAASEMTELREKEKVIKAQMDKQNLIDNAASLKEALEEKKDGHKTYRDLTSPTPVFNEKIEKVAEGEHPKAGLYTKEQFSVLKTIDADISSFKVGGKTVSSDEYMGLVAASSLDPKYADIAVDASATRDKTLFSALANTGIPIEQVKKNYLYQHSDWLFGDFMKTKGLRDGETNLFDSVINPSRQDAVDLLKDYQAGKEGSKKNLAEAISRGINHVVTSIQGRKEFSDMTLKQFRVMNSLANLLDRDPELKAIAMQAPPEGCGVTEKDLKVVRGMAEIDKADLKAAESASKLADAALEGAKPLSEEEKKQLAADVISAKLMKAKLFADIRAIDNDEAHKEVNAKSTELLLDATMSGRMVQTDDLAKWNEHPETRPMPPVGKLYSDQCLEYTNSLLPEINGYPETAIKLAENGSKDFRDLALSIAEKEGYGNMSPEALGKLIVGDKSAVTDAQLVDKGAKILADRQKAPEAAADVPQANKTEIKNEIKNEVPAGPQP